MPHMFKHLPVCPQCCPVHLYVLGVSACDREMQGAIPMFGHPHVFGFLPMWPTHPHIICSPACLYVLGVIACTMGETCHMLGAGELQHNCQAFGVCQYIYCVCYASSCTFLVVHYVSSHYFHGYDYYSFSDGGVFWYVIYFIMTMAPSLMGLSMLGQHDVVLPPLPDTKML